jgi:hypothetical protein
MALDDPIGPTGSGALKLSFRASVSRRTTFAGVMSMSTNLFAWQVKGDRPDMARRMPPWKMTEEQAAQFAADWRCELEKVDGSEEAMRATTCQG